MRHKRNESRLSRLMRRITGRTERTTIGKYSMCRPVPETVSGSAEGLVDSFPSDF